MRQTESHRLRVEDSIVDVVEEGLALLRSALRYSARSEQRSTVLRHLQPIHRSCTCAQRFLHQLDGDSMTAAALSLDIAHFSFHLGTPPSFLLATDWPIVLLQHRAIRVIIFTRHCSKQSSSWQQQQQAARQREHGVRERDRQLPNATFLNFCLSKMFVLSQFLRAKAECFARLCHRLGVCLSVCPSVCLSHSWTVSKRCKLGLRNFHCGLPQCL